MFLSPWIKTLSISSTRGALGLGLLVVEVPDNKIKFYEPIFSEMLQAAEKLSADQVLHVRSPLP